MDSGKFFVSPAVALASISTRSWLSRLVPSQEAVRTTEDIVRIFIGGMDHKVGIKSGRNVVQTCEEKTNGPKCPSGGLPSLPARVANGRGRFQVTQMILVRFGADELCCLIHLADTFHLFNDTTVFSSNPPDHGNSSD